MKCKCGETDPNKFNKTNYYKCQLCARLYSKQWAKEHDTNIKLNRRKTYLKHHKSRIQRYLTHYYRLHNTILQQRRLKRQANLMLYTKLQKEWRTKHPGYVALSGFCYKRNLSLYDIPHEIQQNYLLLYQLKQIISARGSSAFGSKERIKNERHTSNERAA